MTPMQVTELLDFTGGMNTVTAPHLIKRNEAIKLVNADIRVGSLQSMPNLDRSESVAGRYAVDFKGVIYSYDSWRANAEFDNRLYWADGTANGKILEDGTKLPLGISTPTAALTVTPSGLTDGNLEGNLRYTYTFYSTETGVESAPAPLPLSVTVDGDSISLSGFEALPTGANRYRLYRIGGYITLFSMVDELTVSQVPFVDNLDETKIDGRLLHTLRTGVPPDNIRFFTELNGRMYGAVGNNVYFSALGNPDSWYVSDFLTLSHPITGIAKTPAGLLIFSRDTTSLLRGTQPNNFALKVLSDQLGCLDMESVAYVSDSAIWVSRHGICMANGYNIQDITAYKIDNLANIKATSATVVNQVYYVTYRPLLVPNKGLYPHKGLYPSAVEGLTNVTRGIMALDFKRGNGYNFKLIDYKNTSSLLQTRGDVYVITTAPNAVFLPCDQPLDCQDILLCSDHAMSRMNILTTQGITKLTYVSPQLIDSGIAVLKEYEKIRINFRGRFNIKVLFSNGLFVLDTVIDSGHDETTLLTANTEHDIDEFTMLGIPNEQNKSYFISFIIEGVGTINAIQYTWKNRELA